VAGRRCSSAIPRAVLGDGGLWRGSATDKAVHGCTPTRDDRSHMTVWWKRPTAGAVKDAPVVDRCETLGPFLGNLVADGAGGAHRPRASVRAGSALWEMRSATTASRSFPSAARCSAVPPRRS